MIKNSFNQIKRLFLATFLSFALLITLTPPASAATGQYIFPVIGKSSYSNDFTAPRSNGRHNAIDIIANKHQPIVAAASGTITYVAYPQPSWGFMVSIKSASNYEYDYIHMNNDNPGTDDGRGGAMHAYAPDIEQGKQVVRGQLLGWVGDSGNAESTVSHLHFEVRDSKGQPYNPYSKLGWAQRISDPVADYPAANGEFLPFGKFSNNNANLAYEDINNDGVKDMIVGAGYGSKPWVKIFSGIDNSKLLDFYPMSGKGNRGADVATGDFDGDGLKELLVGSQTFYGGKVAVFKYTGQNTVELVGKHTVYGGSVSDVRVAAGDIDGDGRDDIIAGAGPGGGPRITVLGIDGEVKKSFYPFSSNFRGGAEVTAGNVAGDGKDEIISAPFTNGSSYVRVHDDQLDKIKEFRTYASSYNNGVRLSSANIDVSSSYDEIATMPNNHYAMFKYFDVSGDRKKLVYPYEKWWEGTFDVAATNGDYKVIAGGNRRTSIR